MINYIVFFILIICVIFLIRKLLKSRNETTPDINDGVNDGGIVRHFD